MSWVTGIAVFIVVWWLCLFMVLPWGNAPEARPEQGHAPSAPARPRLYLKFLITTVIAAIIWLMIYLFMQAGIFDFYGEAERMAKEDMR